MDKRFLDASKLTPTDRPRRLLSIVELVPSYVIGKQDEIEPIVVLPYAAWSSEVATLPKGQKLDQDKVTRFFICSGNHRGAAAYMCQGSIKAKIITKRDDLKLLKDGEVSKAETLSDLSEMCYEQARELRYLAGGWREYFRDVASCRIAFD